MKTLTVYREQNGRMLRTASVRDNDDQIYKLLVESVLKYSTRMTSGEDTFYIVTKPFVIAAGASILSQAFAIELVQRDKVVIE